MVDQIKPISLAANFSIASSGETTFDATNHGHTLANDMQKPADASNKSKDEPAKKHEAEQKSKAEALAARLSINGSKLIIEKDPHAAGFIYKSLNTETGEVTKIWPKKDIADALQSMPEIDSRGMMLDESA
ncbi:MAG: hypothetical protein J0L55_02875 [Caulobacterales bacterium]|nr:hypothetical protein [Caulobacterales bacterium]MCA0371629.1 hypothetical protein [Pseudomonadota bacterium]